MLYFRTVSEEILRFISRNARFQIVLLSLSLLESNNCGSNTYKMGHSRQNKWLVWVCFSMVFAMSFSSCKTVEKVFLNSPLRDNNSNKYNPIGIKKKAIKHCEITPFDVENGVLKKKKNTFKIYFDKVGKYYKEEKYHLGHLVEYTTYYFDQFGNLREATKYLLFPEKTVSAVAKFEYDTIGHVVLDHVEQGESWQNKYKEYNEYGDLVHQTKVRHRVDKKGRVRQDSSYSKLEYRYDEKNKIEEKFVYNAKTERLKYRIEYIHNPKGTISEATFSRTGKLRKMIKYEHNEEGQVVKELYLDADLNKDKEYEILYDKRGNQIQKNFILKGFESFGKKSTYNRWGNIVKEEIYDNKTNKLIQVWKYNYYRD